MSPSEITLYATAASMIPILMLAIAYQMTLEAWLENEEPLYRSIFPIVMAAVFGFMFIAEGVSLLVLASGEGFALAKPIVISGIMFPLLVLVLAVVDRASDLHEDFSWSQAFEEWEARAARKRAASDRRAAERSEMWRRRPKEGRWAALKTALRGVPPPPPHWLRRRRARPEKEDP